jgi:probable addiction module antidote protein
MKKESVDFKEDFLKELKDPESAEVYLKDAIESGDVRVLLLALRDLAKVQGIAAVAKKTGIGRELLYTILSEKGNPTFENLAVIFNALGFKLHASRKASGD